MPTNPGMCFLFEDYYQRNCFATVKTITGETVLRVGVCFPDSEGMILTPDMCKILWPVLKEFSELNNLNDI